MDRGRARRRRRMRCRLIHSEEAELCVRQIPTRQRQDRTGQDRVVQVREGRLGTAHLEEDPQAIEKSDAHQNSQAGSSCVSCGFCNNLNPAHCAPSTPPSVLTLLFLQTLSALGILRSGHTLRPTPSSHQPILASSLLAFHPHVRPQLLLPGWSLTATSRRRRRFSPRLGPRRRYYGLG